MVRKSIRIDMEAYRLLKQNKREGESLSKLIKRLFPAPRESGSSKDS